MDFHEFGDAPEDSDDIIAMRARAATSSTWVSVAVNLVLPSAKIHQTSLELKSFVDVLSFCEP